MKKLGFLLGILLLMGCSGQRVDAAFERLLDGMFMDAANRSVGDYGFRIRGRDCYVYTTAYCSLSDLSERLWEVNGSMYHAERLGGNDLEVANAVRNIRRSFDTLRFYREFSSEMFGVDDGEAIGLYNEQRVEVDRCLRVMLDRMRYIEERSVFKNPYVYSEEPDTMKYENEYSYSRNDYLDMIDRLEGFIDGLEALPMRLERGDVERIGTAVNFEYSLREGDSMSEYSTFAFYDTELDSITMVERDDLPLDFLLTIGLQRMLDE